MDRKRRRPTKQSKKQSTQCNKQTALSQDLLMTQRISEQHYQNIDDQSPWEQNNDLSKKIQKNQVKTITTASKGMPFEIRNSTAKDNTKTTQDTKRSYLKQKQLSPSFNNLMSILQTGTTQASSQSSFNMIPFDTFEDDLQSQSKSKCKQSGPETNEAKELTFQHFFEELRDNSQPSQPRANIKRGSFIPYKRSNIKDQYQILEKVGEGAFGNVFKCQHKLSKAIRSVKIIKRQALESKHSKQLLKRQIQVLKKLDHPSVIKLFEIFEYQKVVYLVCQFCAGGTLKSYLTPRHKLSLDTKKVILQKIFEAVSYMHSMGIIHRDLKPENILLVNQISPDTQLEQIDIRIIDFGLSIQTKEKQFKDWAKIGSQVYMAPEVFRGVYSAKTDSWSCGVIMHYVLLSSKPFAQSEDLLILEKIAKYRLQDNPKWSSLQPALRQILSSLLNPNYVLRGELASIVINNDMTPRSFKKSYCRHRRVISKLKQFKRNNNFIDFMRYYLTYNKLSQQKIKVFGQYFSQLDKDKNGVISQEELRSYLLTESTIDEQAANGIFQTINLDNSGDINFGQFACALSNGKELFSIEDINEVFQSIDISKDGLVDLFELEHFLANFNKNGQRNVKKLMQQMSNSKKDRVNSNQFGWYVLDKVYLEAKSD